MKLKTPVTELPPEEVKTTLKEAAPDTSFLTSKVKWHAPIALPTVFITLSKLPDESKVGLPHVMVKPGSEANASTVPCWPETTSLTGGAVNDALEILNGMVPVMLSPLEEVNTTSKLASP